MQSGPRSMRARNLLTRFPVSARNRSRRPPRCGLFQRGRTKVLDRRANRDASSGQHLRQAGVSNRLELALFAVNYRLTGTGTDLV